MWCSVVVVCGVVWWGCALNGKMDNRGLGDTLVAGFL